MRKPTIALNMIVKDETEELDRCLASIAPYVDGIYITITGTNKDTESVCKKYNAVVSHNRDALKRVSKADLEAFRTMMGWDSHLKEKERIFFFDEARNYALSQVPDTFDYVVWLDADDVWRGGKHIAETLERMQKEKITAVFMNYIYEAEFDTEGRIKNILIEHLRERIFVHDGRYHWVAPIHETLISKTGEVRQIEVKNMDVLHLSQRKRREDAIQRNIRVLEKSIIDQKGKDPRPIYYLAKAFFDLHTAEYYDKAIKLIFAYLEKSGWAEERAQAYEYLAEMYRAQGKYNMALKAAFNALIESPKFPSSYLSIALTLIYLERYDDALHWLRLGANIERPSTTLVVNPRDWATRTLEIAFNVALKQNKLDEAWAAITKLVDYFPEDKGIQEQYTFMQSLVDERETTKAFINVAKKLRELGENDKLQQLMLAAPSSIAQNPIVSDLYKQVMPKKQWGEKEIALYCGPGWTIWNPKSWENKESFIGGSEEAVILATREIAKKGWKVTVYGDPGEEGEYDGVTYLNYFKFNPLDSFNILISWRNIQFFQQKYNAKRTYLWLHDVPNPQDYTQERLENIDKIMVLSKYHRSLLPDVKDEKFIITTNGLYEFLPKVKPTNEPTRCIWTSSYDRGLQHLLEVWPDVVKEVPDAELHIFYGWTLFDKFYHNNPERQAWKKKIETMMGEKGITHHGRVSQEKLEREYKKAGAWTYPTDFQEINCISGLKAQAFGAIPVCTNYAALKDTVTFGEKIDGDIWDAEVKAQYKDMLISVLKNPDAYDRETMITATKKKYSWENVVSSWIKDYETIL